MFDMIAAQKNKTTCNKLIDSIRDEVVKLQKKYEFKRCEGYYNELKKYAIKWMGEWKDTMEYGERLHHKRMSIYKRNEKADSIVKSNPLWVNWKQIADAGIRCYCIMWIAVIISNAMKGLTGWDVWQSNDLFLFGNWLFLAIRFFPVEFISHKYHKKGLTRKEDKWENCYFKQFDNYLNANSWLDNFLDMEKYAMENIEYIERLIEKNDRINEIIDQYNNLLDKAKKIEQQRNEAQEQLKLYVDAANGM